MIISLDNNYYLDVENAREKISEAVLNIKDIKRIIEYLA